MKKHPSHSFGGAGPSDPQSGASELVRDLLDAGRAEHAGYDAEAGLARHLAFVQSGAPTPEWAHELLKGAGAGAGAAAAGTLAVGGGAKLAGAKLLPWIAISLVLAGAATFAVLSSSPSTTPADPIAAPEAAPTTKAPGAPATQEDATDGRDRAAAVEPDSTGAQGVRAEQSADDVLARVKRDVLARRAARSPQNASAKVADSRSVDALMGAAEGAKSSSSEGTVKLAPRGATKSSTDTTKSSDTTKPSASAQDQAQADQATVAPKGEAVQPQPVAPAPVDARGSSRAGIDDSRLEREMGMLAMAQRVLTSDPERALRLARQGEQEFAGSMFTQERQQVLLLALIQLGRMPEAKRLAQPYLKRYPNGPFSDRLRRALATGKVASEPGPELDN